MQNIGLMNAIRITVLHVQEFESTVLSLSHLTLKSKPNWVKTIENESHARTSPFRSLPPGKQVNHGLCQHVDLR